MADHTLVNKVDSFLKEWLDTTVRTQDSVKSRDFSWLETDFIILNGAKGIQNGINRAGYEFLVESARELLYVEKLEKRVSQRTAKRVLVESLSAHVPKAVRTGRLSEHAVISGAKWRLAESSRHNGLYIFPVLFAPIATETDFSFGSVRLLSKPIFESQYNAVASAGATSDSELVRHLSEEWTKYSGLYDHFLVVPLDGYEPELGWIHAREIGDFILNLIRMLFRFSHTDRIRIGGGFAWETTQAQLLIDQGGHPSFSLSRGPFGTVIENGWVGHFQQACSGLETILASFVGWMVSGSDARNPVLERTCYAHRLITEAYSEPYDPIRLVRTIAALETFAVLGRTDKAHNLALCCAYVGSNGNSATACDIYDHVKEAYFWRNRIVHGDASDNSKIMNAFYKLETHLFDLNIGFMSLFVSIMHRRRPRTVKQLRKYVAEDVEAFYWNPASMFG